MGGVLDCSADPLEGEVDFSNMEGPIVKPFHAMSIRELAYNVKYDAEEDARRGSKDLVGGVVGGGRNAGTTIPDKDQMQTKDETSTSQSLLEPATTRSQPNPSVLVST